MLTPPGRVMGAGGYGTRENVYLLQQQLKTGTNSPYLQFVICWACQAWVHQVGHLVSEKEASS